MRKSFDGLMAIIRDKYELDPYANALYLFCGRDKRKIKALHFDKDGFVLLQKRLDGRGRFQRNIRCLSPAKKHKLYKSSINKSIHFAQRRLSNSTRVQVQRVTAQLNLSRE